MSMETSMIRYLLDEIEERQKEIAEYESIDHEQYEKEHGKNSWWWVKKPQKKLISDNCKKIRQLALKIAKKV